MSRQLDESDEALLQAALSSSFTRLPLQPPGSNASIDSIDSSSSAPDPSTLQSADPSVASSQSEDSWKAEYDRQLATWRAEAEVARLKAERTRAEWEARRLAEEKQETEARAKQLREGESLAAWETVNSTEDPGSTQQLNTEGDPTRRDLATGESHNSPTVPSPSIITQEPFAASEEEESRISRHWEDIHSLASSFPSLPENISSSSSTGMVPPLAGRPRDNRTALNYSRDPGQGTSPSTAHRLPARAPQPPSLTASILGRGLAPRARILALLSSFAINLLLPFVNGVMLGFGEIFARNVIGPFFGWKAPGIGSIGIRSPTRERRAKESERIR